jgi:acetolactate synthase regulatory subunit
MATSAAESASESTTPVVQSPSSGQTGLSDLSSATPTQQGYTSMEMQHNLTALHGRARELKEECRSIRSLQLNFQQSIKDELNAAYRRIQEVLPGVPGANDLPVRAQRFEVNDQLLNYKMNTQKADQDLKDLEISVEELRGDVLNKRCRVNMSEVEMMALALSNVSKALSDLKAKFPLLQDGMKTVMSGEMECVVTEEKLASVQEQRPPASVNIAPTEPKDDDRKNLLENILAVAPNHDARIQSLEAAENRQERKKKLVVTQDQMRFEKALELQTKKLRDINGVHSNGVAKQQDNGDNGDRKANMPLTDTTKRLSLVGKEEGSSSSVSSPDSSIKSQDQSSQQTPPPKPPRTMLYEEGPATSATVMYGSTAERMLMKNGAPISTSTPKPNSAAALISYGATSVVTRSSPVPNKSVDSIKTTSPSKMPLPITTSTPVLGAGKISTHVTFASTVTEIRDSSPTSRALLNDSSDMKGGRKVPPPPPPRRSSRLITQSPQGGRPFSPPAYENIENFPAKSDANDSGSSEISIEVKSPQAIINNLNAMSQSNGRPEAQDAQKTRNGGGNGARPASKFKQELAAGIYANMNRPDLQGQKLNHASTLRDAKSDDRNASYNNDSDSSVDSQTGIVVKRAYRQDSPSSDGKGTVNKDGVKMRDAKKKPPPPPVRRSSALTSIQKATIPEDMAGATSGQIYANREDKRYNDVRSRE